MVKLSPRKNKQLSPKVTKLSKWHGPVVSDSKATFFPHHPAPPLCPDYGQHTPSKHSTAQSEALDISCQGSSSNPCPGSLLGCEADSLFTGHRSGLAKPSMPVCLLLPSPLIQTFSESVMVKSTDSLCWAHCSLWGRCLKPWRSLGESAKADRWPLASLREGAVCWVGSSRVSSPSPKQSWITTPAFQPQMFSCSQPGSKWGRPYRMEP